MAAASRLVYGTDDDHEYQVPCGRQPALPSEPQAAADLANGQHYEAFCKTMDHPGWEPISYEDPEQAKGGDLRLLTKEVDWSIHFIKATFTVAQGSPKDVMDLVASEQLDTRKRFSKDISELEYLLKLPDNSTVARVTYWVPPPLASREMIFLQGRKETSDTIEVWGCSVTDDRWPDEGSFGKKVRAKCFWGWRAVQVGNGCLVSYFSCSDPAGGIPNVFFRWAKTAVSGELMALRTVLRGDKPTFDGSEQDAIMEEYKQQTGQ
eukprot:TRINITY_DN2021_c0_g1_i1.p1 TRINITY_DN2021_c0_g1~~TRINITY_DN2021_c0_g1_i1.p1  ORF type:complete len:294 (+),score=91.03 TRINITY_DN2021_c0_g1_i1:93-884(+)